VTTQAKDWEEEYIYGESRTVGGSINKSL